MQDQDIKNQETTTQTNQNPNLEQQLSECLIQKDEWKDRCLRTAAEFENYKRRSEKERVLWITNTQASILTDVIGLVDDFERAFANKDETCSLQGFELIYKSLQKILEKYGVQEIKEVTEFDPNLHEAIMQVESPDHKAGQIVQVLQKGYRFKDQILRPAKVSVANG
ncbi:MAG: protein GrpE [Candidatus Babeliales bacterium]